MLGRKRAAMAQSTPKTRIVLLMMLVMPMLFVLAKAQCNPQDQEALLQIKASLTPQSSSLVNNWDPNTRPCCQWRGVTCNGLENRVTRLQIDSPDLVGPIPPAIGNLTQLDDLVITAPNLSGPIPTSICSLTILRLLTISGTSISGTIPQCIGELQQLKQIQIDENPGLSGPIPKTIGSLTKLAQLYMPNNNLSGSIPSEMGLLVTLFYLRLENNQLSGSIPESLGLLPRISTIHLGNNRLTGKIPDSFASFPGIEQRKLFIMLGGNRLSGIVPKAMAQLIPDKLASFLVEGNKLHGDPSFLFGPTNAPAGSSFPLGDLDLSNNDFKFNLSKVVLHQNFNQLNISHNRIYGSLPPNLDDHMTDERILDVSYNRLCGPIPTFTNTEVSPETFKQNKCLCGPPLQNPCN